MKRNSFVLFILFFPLSLFARPAYLHPVPFSIGEKLTYSMSVRGVPFGDQTVAIEGVRTFEGQRVVSARVTMVSTGAARALYRLDDTETTLFLPSGVVPVFYAKEIHEGNFNDYLEVRYSGSGGFARLYDRYANSSNRIAVPADVKNVFTLIFSLRSLDYTGFLGTGKKIAMDYLLGDKLYRAVFTAVPAELKLGGKIYRTIYLEQSGGPGTKFWFEDSAARVPLKMVIPSYNAGGRQTDMVAELKSFTPGTVSVE